MAEEKPPVDAPEQWRSTNDLPGPAREGAMLNLSMRPDLVGVWGYRVGSWTRGPGWYYLFHIDGLAPLIRCMKKERLQGRVRQIGIVAHGDDDGVVQLDPLLTAASVRSAEMEDQLAELGEYLVEGGMLIFYSCIAGKMRRGSEFLAALSKKLMDRVVVAFELWGLIGPDGPPNQAGMMKAIDTPVQQHATDPKSQHGYLDPWCLYAKWARNGDIKRVPLLERQDKAERRRGGPAGGVCANPHCGGHDKLDDRCPDW